MPQVDENALLASIKALEPTACSPMAVSDFTFRLEFRALCEANRCGHYNKKWTCPPLVGEAEDLINTVKSYQRGVLYQYIGQLKHSMDWKGTLAAGKVFNAITVKIVEDIAPTIERSLVLGAGPCPFCDVCAAKKMDPCRFPEKAVRSLEAHCVDVNAIAGVCGMKYINGPNTVTLFGGLLF
ncbi:MAG: DUF2284 domain-containing protein [Deltaproteobacteria bacterium]|jgi:predicted metal-binding protein|nr:DUF2284 domain-containing protein [Deltaproteobacteria bacterium]